MIENNSNRESIKIINSAEEEEQNKNLIIKNSSETCLKLIAYAFILLILIISFSQNKNPKEESEFTKEKNNNISFNNITENISNTDNTSKTISPSDTDKNTDTDKKSDKIITTDDTSKNILNTDDENDNKSDTKEEEKISDKTEEKHIYVPKPIPRKSSFTFKDYQDYYKLAREGKFLYKENLVQSKTPFISVIIALYNAEKFINQTLKTVQNQRMKDIEIIIVDDCSKDKSLLYVEEAQKIDPRIKIIKNKKNMAILYTKSIGVLIANGDYIFSLDDDDILLTDDLFEIIYESAISQNWDIIEYRWIDSRSYDLKENSVNMNPFCVHRIGLELKQPALRRRYNRDEKGRLHLPDRYIWGRLIVRHVYVKVVAGIGLTDLKKRFITHDDTITTFMLFKFASSFKKIDKVGLCHFVNDQTSGSESRRWNPEVIFDTCSTFINYVEIMYKNTENEFVAKEEVFFAFRIWVLECRCNSYDKTLNQAINLAKQMFNDPLMTNYQKGEIRRVFGKYF